MLVLAGAFEVAGDQLADSVATYDPATGTWGSLPGLVGDVADLAVLPTGELVASTVFPTTGSFVNSRVVRWDGATWQPLGAVADHTMSDLLVASNGDLYVCGGFSVIGTTTVNGVARWDGSAWQALGAGIASSPTGKVNALAQLPSGQIVAGGLFSQAGGAPASCLAAWDGITWSSFAGGANDEVHCLHLAPDATLVAGGGFSSIGGVSANRIARWNGATWTRFGTGFSMGVIPTGWVLSVTTLANGNVVAAGIFTVAGGVGAVGVARWTGTVWQPLGSGLNHAGNMGSGRALLEWPGGPLFVGGDFTNAGGVGANYIAGWNNGWTRLGTGMNDRVLALAGHANGDVVAGGVFLGAGDIAASRVARLRNGVWQALGNGITGSVECVAILPNGEIVVGGNFQNPTTRIARWNGSAWVGFGPGANGAVLALHVAPNGDLIAGGDFTAIGGTVAARTARWDGASWHALGSGPPGAALALASLSNGDLVAAGGNYVARWDGAVWTTLGSTVGFVRALAVLPDGDLVAGGSVQVGWNRIARWTGSAWVTLGSGAADEVRALAVLPNGHLIAAGAFTSIGGNPANRLAAWNGASWQPFTSGLGGTVNALAMRPDGEIVVGGWFLTAGTAVSSYIARAASACPASAVPYATSCSASNGPMVATATTLPWVGSTFRSQCTGFGNHSLGASLLGLVDPGTPLVQLLPVGVAGCQLLASPDASLLVMPAAGSATSAYAMPTVPAAVGLVLRHQFLQVEFDANLAIVALAGSQGLLLTLGGL